MRHVFASLIGLVALGSSCSPSSGTLQQRHVEQEQQQQQQRVEQVMRPPQARDHGVDPFKAPDRATMMRVTREPYRVDGPDPTLCARFENPHEAHWIEVFVSPEGREPMMTGKGKYPLGTIILKQKLLDESGERTDLYTGMRKREYGYNPRVGDWEFFTLDASGTRVTSRGKLSSCIDCHEHYAATDYVSREYLTSQEEREPSVP